jgi:hypothetical protein
MGFIAGSAMSVLVGTARAEPTPVPGSTAAEALARANVAQTKADDASDRADELAKGSGWQYKTGVYQAAERQAATYEAEASAARAEATGANLAPMAVSPAMTDAQERVANLKKTSGWAWKTGAIDRAEADVQAIKGPKPYLTSQYEGLTQKAPPKSQNKPADQVEQTEQLEHTYR